MATKTTTPAACRTIAIVVNGSTHTVSLKLVQNKSVNYSEYAMCARAVARWCRDNIGRHCVATWNLV